MECRDCKEIAKNRKLSEIESTDLEQLVSDALIKTDLDISLPRQTSSTGTAGSGDACSECGSTFVELVVGL